MKPSREVNVSAHDAPAPIAAVHAITHTAAFSSPNNGVSRNRIGAGSPGITRQKYTKRIGLSAPAIYPVLCHTLGTFGRESRVGTR
jgi:hypothetical protein